MSDAVIKLENVKKSYGSHEVLKGVNMLVNRGDIYGLIGRNGAGKTTIFKMILGLSEMNAGTVSIMGSTNKKTLLKNRSRVGFLVCTRFYSYLNARRNLEYYATVKGASRTGSRRRRSTGCWRSWTCRGSRSPSGAIPSVCSSASASPTPSSAIPSF